MRAAVALALCLATLPAAAQQANRNAEREARSWLKPCKEPTHDGQQLCLINQRNFIEMYVWAKSGDTSAMGSTYYSFRPRPVIGNPAVDYQPGYPTNVIQSCAWLITKMQSMRENPVAERDTLLRLCTAISPNEQTAALERADQLLAELRQSPAQAPADDWEPRVAGLNP